MFFYYQESESIQGKLVYFANMLFLQKSNCQINPNGNQGKQSQKVL